MSVVLILFLVIANIALGFGLAVFFGHGRLPNLPTGWLKKLPLVGKKAS